MIAGKQPEGRNNEFFTFEYFMSQIDANSGGQKGKPKHEIIADEWARVQKRLSPAQGVVQRPHFVHKIGFLVTVGHDLRALMVDSKIMTKRAFKDSLDQKIVGALNVSRDEFLSLSLS